MAGIAEGRANSMADVFRMISISHWGLFEVLTPYRSHSEDQQSGMERLVQFLQDRDDRVLYGVPGFENMGLRLG